MSDTIQILLGKAKSADSINEDTSITIEMTQNMSPLLDNATVGTVDLNEQFIRERDACNKYRLTLTVNPFCSNVLYNACSEFIINEGSGATSGDDKLSCITMDETHNFTDAYGKSVGVNALDLIRNSEYSREDIGVDYHPGMDFFNNHILRNKSYRIVNRNTVTKNKNVFNTISDYLRSDNGRILTRCCRKDITDNKLMEKHLYDHDDILEFSTGDAVTENLREKDGWFGFYNTNVIPAKDSSGDDMDISRAINNRGNCEFIDMYPDRTLYSFVPKYNKFRNRMESNWDLQLTYPYDNVTGYETTSASGDTIEHDFKVVQDGTTNGLVILTCEYVRGPQGENLLLFRTATKHNLEIDDHVHIYYNEDEEDGHWHTTDIAYRVAGTGDMKGDYRDYYFYISDDTLLEQIFATPKSHDTGVTAWDYVRDYFYAVLDESAIEDFDPDTTYYRNNLVKYNSKVYICVLDYYASGLIPTHTSGNPNSFIATTTTPSTSFLNIDTTYFQLFGPDYYQEYAEQDDEGNTLGLTNIPSAYDGYIKVGSNIYELYNHDLDLHYFNSPMDTNKFIRQIINNAFKSGDDADISPAMSGSLWRDYISLRMVKTDGDHDCEYYVRKFKKVPNIRTVSNSSGQPVTVDKNFETVSYPLAFASTIYGDQVGQAVVTDTIDITDLKDASGQDVRDIYLTIIKANRGYKEWYLNQSTNGTGKTSSAVEFSHCFGPVTCGFDFFELNSDSDSVKDKLKSMTYVRMICNDYSGDEQTLGEKTDITIDDDWYYGDIVEYCPWTCDYTTLCEVNFRFNTAQRDLDLSNSSAYSFNVDEIAYDDYDYKSFQVKTYSSTDAIHRPEGYYYKPHYKIRLKGKTAVSQSSHNRLSIFKAEPIQLNGMYIKVTTNFKHNIHGGRVLLRDDTNDVEWWLNVIKVISKNEFIFDKISRSETQDRYRDWITICENLNNGDYTLLAENTEIPSYANKIGKGTYIWRNTVLGNDIANVDTDVPEYIFANGHHYVEETINLFLRRQDPEEVNGLYYSGNNLKLLDDEDFILGDCTADTEGEVIEEANNEEYKEEKFTLC